MARLFEPTTPLCFQSPWPRVARFGDAHTSYPSYAHPHAKAQQDSGSDVSDDWERLTALNDVVQIEGDGVTVFLQELRWNRVQVNSKIVIKRIKTSSISLTLTVFTALFIICIYLLQSYGCIECCLRKAGWQL